MKAEMLEQEFRPRSAAPAGGPLLLRAADALELVDRAAEEGVPILGVDTFRLPAAGAGMVPDRIADYSAGVAEGHGCWADAEAFIRARPDEDLAFELTLGDDPLEVV